MMQRIMIDPGHGGSESGAVNKYVKEKDINLIVSNNLKKLLEDRGFEVAMTRYNDTYVSLNDRCNIANAWGPDLFISVHHNAGNGDGYEVIHSIHGGKGKEFAELVGQEFSKLGQNKRRVFSRESEKHSGTDFYTVIKNTTMPAVITEFGFMDTNDYEAFDTVEELQREAEAIYKAVCRFYGMEDKRLDKIIDVNEALDILVEKGIINSKEYWVKTIDTVKHQKELLLNMANAVK